MARRGEARINLEGAGGIRGPEWERPLEPEGCGEEWEAEEMRRAIEAKEDWDDEDEEY